MGSWRASLQAERSSSDQLGSSHCFSGDGGSHRSTAKARITEQWIEAGYTL